MSLQRNRDAIAMGSISGHQHDPPFPDPDTMGHEIHEEAASRVDINGEKAPRRFFRRPRAGRACGTCHSRRVRCDAGSHGIPCSNCAAFSLDCSIPPKKKKKRDGNTVGGLKRRKQRGRPAQDINGDEQDINVSIVSSPDDFASVVLQADQQIKQQADDDELYVKIVKPEQTTETRLVIEDPGRVAYLEEFSNMALLVKEYQGPAGVHYPLPKIAKDSTLSTRMNDLELQILQTRGALSLPPKELCDELVQAYFEWIAPIVPIINHASFMQQYHDPSNPPSLLLMQAILLAGSRVCATPLLLDSNGSAIPAATLFYQRAKALYDADYEEDRVTLVQALILMGWYWEDPGKVPKNVFYWNGLAVTVAQGCGMHRNTQQSRLSLADQRLWARIWWTLYTRDRSVAAALGRPTHINLEGSDAQMVCEDDFIEADDVQPNTAHARFFLQYVKLCEIMDLILFQNYSISPKAQQRNAMALTQCDLALAEWLQYCPAELRWDQSRYGFWPAYLHVVYNTASCLLHRAHLPPTPSPPLCTILTRSPAFEAAHTITTIVQNLIAHDNLKHAPPFVIYSMLSALMVHIYHLHTALPGDVEIQRQSILLCMDALQKLSDLWLVGKMVHDLFKTVLAFDGFDLHLKQGPRNDSHQKLAGVESDLEELTVDECSTPESQTPEKAIKSLSLTPALVAHMDAALKSAATPNKPATFLHSSRWTDSHESVLAGHPVEGRRWQPLAPRGEHHGQHHATWMDFELPSTPGPTGLNAAEWFHFFGIQ